MKIATGSLRIKTPTYNGPLVDEPSKIWIVATNAETGETLSLSLQEAFNLKYQPKTKHERRKRK